MDIKILDSWLREHLETQAKPDDIAKALSLTSASVEKIEAYKNDFIYHIEITTNRVDMASVTGIAREAAAVLPQFGFEARLVPHVETLHATSLPNGERQTIEIQNNDKLVKRVCCVILEVTKKESPQYIKDRLETAGIRSLNNLIDITNYVMLEMGHPTHAFDYDRLTTKKLIIREAKKGEKVITLDKKEHILPGGDIVADNGTGEIIDLLGIMGTANSVVQANTKRILFFIDNLDPAQVRKTSMFLGIRTEAAGLNEKNVDPELAMPALLRGIELYTELADARISSDITDIYPHPWKPKTITVSEGKINQVIGVPISLRETTQMLERLNFAVHEHTHTPILDVTIPSYRDADMNIAEDVIEEIARMYGYHNLPSKLPTATTVTSHQYINQFFWEKRTKDALKYWGFTEVYTYSMVSEKLFVETKPVFRPIQLKNPLDTDHVYMRQQLLPSLLEVINENKSREEVRIFELANVYHPNQDHNVPDLPDEILILAGIVKGKQETFFTVKGILEQIATDLGIKELIFQDAEKGKIGAKIYIHKNFLGEITVIEQGLISFQLNFAEMLKHATAKKVYTPIPKYPPIIEDMAFTIDATIKTGDIMKEIKNQSALITEVSLLDQYEDKRTFHILYQDKEKNLTNEEVGEIREKIVSAVEKKFSAKIQ